MLATADGLLLPMPRAMPCQALSSPMLYAQRYFTIYVSLRHTLLDIVTPSRC